QVQVPALLGRLLLRVGGVLGLLGRLLLRVGGVLGLLGRTGSLVRRLLDVEQGVLVRRVVRRRGRLRSAPGHHTSSLITVRPIRTESASEMVVGCVMRCPLT